MVHSKTRDILLPHIIIIIFRIRILFFQLLYLVGSLVGSYSSIRIPQILYKTK